LFVNGVLVINDWTDHAATTRNAPAVTLVSGQRYDIVLEYYDRTGGAVARLNWQVPGATSFVPLPVTQLFATTQGLSARYFGNATLSGTPLLVRSEPVNFDWSTGAPAASVPANNFSVSWAGRIAALTDGNYTFQTTSDDGVRLWVDGALVVDDWTVHAPTTKSSPPIALKAGFFYDIRLEYFDAQNGAVAKLGWTRPGTTTSVPIPQDSLYPY
jgi:hypothetical protein